VFNHTWTPKTDNLEEIKDAIRAMNAEALGENRKDSTARMLHVLILNKCVGQHKSLLSVTDISSGGGITRAERLTPVIGPYYSDQLSRHAAGVAINAASDDHIVGHLAHGALAVKLSVPN
jgi:hypothetical protein